MPYTPGGSTEILARIVGQKLEERLGKSVMIENKPGAGTVIGSNQVAKSAPDGYTLLMSTPTPMAINVTLHKQLPYDPATDLIPLVMVAGAPFVLVVQPVAAGEVGEGADRLRQGASRASFTTAPAGRARRITSMPSCSPA